MRVVRTGVVHLAEGEVRDGAYQEAVSIFVDQRTPDRFAWRMQVEAIMGVAGSFPFARFVVAPANRGHERSRVVAICSCPGVESWRVRVDRLTPLGVTAGNGEGQTVPVPIDVYLRTSRHGRSGRIEFPSARYHAQGFLADEADDIAMQPYQGLTGLGALADDTGPSGIEIDEGPFMGGGPEVVTELSVAVSASIAIGGDSAAQVPIGWGLELDNGGLASLALEWIEL